MIAIMWQFDVKAGRETEFEQLYGADGAWTAMNRHTRSYLGSSFLHDQNQASRYVVIDTTSPCFRFDSFPLFGASISGRCANFGGTTPRAS